MWTSPNSHKNGETMNECETERNEVGFGSRPNELVLQERMDGYGGRESITCDKCGDTKVRDVLVNFDRIRLRMKHIYCPHCVDECGCNG